MACNIFMMNIYINNSLRRLSLILIELFIVNSFVSAQAQQCVFGEFLGASTGFGAHYDARFNENTNWGFRVGLAFTDSHSEDFFDSNPSHTTGWTIPIGLNYLFFKNKSHLELGGGFSFGRYHCVYKNNPHEYENDKSGTFLFFDIGYRYQTEKGLMFRAGFNPGIALSRSDDLGRREHGVDRAALIYPYVSFGYSF
jgi:hypothetical protein